MTRQIAIALGILLATLGITALACGTANANTIKAKVGEEFTITLESNRTTGYGWELAQSLDESIVKLISSSYKEPQDVRMVGQGGEQVWIFKAVGKGTTEISMKYVRSWEKDTPPAKTQEYKIVVK